MFATYFSLLVTFGSFLFGFANTNKNSRNELAFQNTTLPSQATGLQKNRTVDELIAEAFSRYSAAYIEAESQVMVITGALTIDTRELAPGELIKVKSLLDTGFWQSENGARYDLTKAAIIVRDGKGGLGDVAAIFASDEFIEAYRGRGRNTDSLVDCETSLEKFRTFKHLE